MPAVKSKPAKQQTAVSDAAIREAEQNHQHLLRLCDAIGSAYHASQRFLGEQGQPQHPSDHVRGCVANIFATIAEHPGQSWPKNSWMLLEVLGKIADELSPLGSHAFTSAAWKAGTVYKLTTLAEAATLYLSPPHERPAFERTLESVAEFRRQGLSERQICRCYDFRSSDGSEDLEHLRKVIKDHGEDYAPTVIIAPQTDARIPKTRPPVAGKVADYADVVSRWSSDDSIAAELQEAAAVGAGAEYFDDPADADI